MDDEIVIVLVPKRQNRAAESEAEDFGIRRVFSGPDRFKKARRFLNAMQEVESEQGQ